MCVHYPDRKRTASGSNLTASTLRTQEVLEARETILTRIAAEGGVRRKRW